VAPPRDGCGRHAILALRWVGVRLVARPSIIDIRLQGGPWSVLFWLALFVAHPTPPIPSLGWKVSGESPASPDAKQPRRGPGGEGGFHLFSAYPKKEFARSCHVSCPFLTSSLVSASWLFRRCCRQFAAAADNRWGGHLHGSFTAAPYLKSRPSDSLQPDGRPGPS